MKKPVLIALGVLALAACDQTDDMLSPEPSLEVAEARKAAEAAPTGMFDITIENLTTYGGQHFTPPVVAIHRNGEDFFTEGKSANPFIQGIAENGAVPAFAEYLMASRHVSSSAVAASGMGLEGPLAPGESVTVSLSADPGSNFVSFASMLICTNDGFTGVDAAKLPKKVGDEIYVYAMAYDAGTEINTEDLADLVPPCQALGGVSSDSDGTGASDPALAEGGVIRAHPGITGRADLVPAIHGWEGAVAKFTVLRTG
jgi:hypothetical protein